MEDPGEVQRDEVREEPKDGSEVAERINEAALKPEEAVERGGDFQQAESVEAAFNASLDAVQGRSEEVSATPITLPKEDPDGVPDPASEVSATPITLPKEDPDGVPDPASEVSATPITLPKEDPDGVPKAIEDTGSQPIESRARDVPVAGTGEPAPVMGDLSALGGPDSEGEASATPITLPKEDPDEAPRSSEEISATPIPLPGPGDEVSATPIPLPDPEGEVDEPLREAAEGAPPSIESIAAVDDRDWVEAGLDGKGGDTPEPVVIDTEALPARPGQGMEGDPIQESAGEFFAAVSVGEEATPFNKNDTTIAGSQYGTDVVQDPEDRSETGEVSSVNTFQPGTRPERTSRFEEPEKGEPARVMEEEQPVQGTIGPEAAALISDRLPDGAESFTDQAGATIVRIATTYPEDDYLISTRDAISENFPEISQVEEDALLASSLLKASQALRDEISAMEDKLNSIGDDAQLGNIDLQNML